MDIKSRKRLKIALWSVAGITAVVFVGFAVVFIYVFSSVMDVAFHTPENKILLQRISVSSGSKDYLLMTNGRLFERTWYIYGVSAGSPPTAEMLSQTSYGPALLSNYAESGNHCTDEKLEIVGARYLIFWRGGVRHNLYDLKTEQVLFNLEAPWFEYPEEDGKRPTPDEFHEWALIAMDQKIQGIIAERSD